MQKTDIASSGKASRGCPDTTRARLAEQERAIISAVKSLQGVSGIKSVSTKNLMSLPILEPGRALELYIEFCPLYLLKEDRPFEKYADLVDKESFCRQDIIDSCIGTKWVATELVLSALKRLLSTLGVELHLQAVFWDIGVILTSRDLVIPGVLEKHAEVYRKSLHEFCVANEIGYNFVCASSYDQSDLSEFCRVGQYCFIEEGEELDEPPSEAEILKLLDLDKRFTLDNRAGRRAAKLFLKRLSMSYNNFGITRAFIHTYLSVTPHFAQKAHVRLGMEVVDIFLALASAEAGSPQAEMPAINVLQTC
jgi:hypothetical protein